MIIRGNTFLPMENPKDMDPSLINSCYFGPCSLEYESKIFLSDGSFFFQPIFVNCIQSQRQICSFDTKKAVLTTRWKIFGKKAENFMLSVRKRWKKTQKKSLKCSHGHVECSSNNPAESFLPKAEKFQNFRSMSEID